MEEGDKMVVHSPRCERGKKLVTFMSTHISVVMVHKNVYHVKNSRTCRVLVPHTCYPSYSRGRDQEDCGSKLARAKKFARPYLKKLLTKIGLVKWLKVKWLKPQYAKKKK
jgi:hypothetical protein